MIDSVSKYVADSMTFLVVVCVSESMSVLVSETVSVFVFVFVLVSVSRHVYEILFRNETSVRLLPRIVVPVCNCPENVWHMNVST